MNEKNKDTLKAIEKLQNYSKNIEETFKKIIPKIHNIKIPEFEIPKIEVEGFQCERCGHKWVPRGSDEEPSVCPKCKSPYWNKPRKRKVKKH